MTVQGRTANTGGGGEKPITQENACMASFEKSPLGKVVQFASPLSLVTDFKHAWPDWTVFPGAKYLIIQGLKRLGPTVAAVVGSIEEKATPAILAIPVATAFDAGMRQFCSDFPNATPHF
jgi:hypothetical protein